MDTTYARLDDERVLPEVRQPGGPRVWLAGFGTTAFADAGRLADGWLPYPPTPDEYRHGLRRVRDAAEAAGRSRTSVEAAVMVTINVGETTPSRRELEAYVQEFYGYPLDGVSLVQACRTGTVGQVLADLRAYWDAGARSFVLRLASLDEPARQLDTVVEHLIPEIRSWSAA